MGIDTSAWRKIIGSFHLTNQNNRRISISSNGKVTRSSLQITKDGCYPVSFILLMSVLAIVFTNIILASHFYECPCVPLLKHCKSTPAEYRDTFHGFIPRVESSAEVLHSTSITLIPYELLLLAMDINPNPGPPFSFTRDFSSLTPAVKQTFNLYKRTATKVTRHEFHLKTYQFYLQEKFIPKGLKPRLRPAIEPVSEDFFSKWNDNTNQLGFSPTAPFRRRVHKETHKPKQN